LTKRKKDYKKTTQAEKSEAGVTVNINNSVFELKTAIFVEEKKSTLFSSSMLQEKKKLLCSTNRSKRTRFNE